MFFKCCQEGQRVSTLFASERTSKVPKVCDAPNIRCPRTPKTVLKSTHTLSHTSTNPGAYINYQANALKSTQSVHRALVTTTIRPNHTTPKTPSALSAISSYNTMGVVAGGMKVTIV